jgi:carbon monoxide dehydrogenase subunit G
VRRTGYIVNRVAVVETTAVLPAPPEQVEAYVTDPAKVVELSPDIESYELSGPLAVGTKVREVRRVLGRRMELEWRVTEYEPNRRIVFDWKGKRMSVTGAVHFEPVDGGTRVSTHNDIHATGAFRLLEGLIARGVRREERTMFERLRTRLA